MSANRRLTEPRGNLADTDVGSWLNEDDTIGSKVFFWTHDDLDSGDTINFSERRSDPAV